MPLPVYIVAPPGGRADAIAADDLADSVRRLASVDELGSLDEKEPGLVLVDRETVHDAELVALADRVSRGPVGWVLGVIEGGVEPTVRTLGLGLPNSCSEVVSLAMEPNENRGVLMELRGVLDDVARLRHDLNNALTSALAEVQLLLFDRDDDESLEALDVIQGQLRRMRDLVASTSHMRSPRA